MAQKKTQGWYATDRAGLRKLIAHKGKTFVIHELIQNSWDTNADLVTITLNPIPHKPLAHLTVVDNDPDGFTDLSHAYTLFAESEKKDDPTKRGRFNLGEKLVLAICRSARIESTKGTVIFNEDETRSRSRSRRKVGTSFSAVIEMTRAEYDEVCNSIHQLIPPHGVIPHALTTVFNGEEIMPRVPVAQFEATLPTLRSDEEGNLKPTKRITTVFVHEVEEGEVASIYELGIPVVETGDKYHLDVQQKVPVNLDRDNVPPSYLRTLRALALNEVHDKLDRDEAADTWVSDAIAHGDIEGDAVETVMDQRFTKQRAIYDPSDKEANSRLASRGVKIIHGGSMSKAEWGNVRRFEAAKPSGVISPTPKPWSDDPDAPEAKFLEREKWNQGMIEIEKLCQSLAKPLLGLQLDVSMCLDGNFWTACFVKGGLCGARLTFNLKRIKHTGFEMWKLNKAWWLDLIIHEFSHYYASDHLSEKYHKGLSQLGGELAVLALKKPELFA